MSNAGFYLQIIACLLMYQQKNKLERSDQRKSFTSFHHILKLENGDHFRYAKMDNMYGLRFTLSSSVM